MQKRQSSRTLASYMVGNCWTAGRWMVSAARRDVLQLPSTILSSLGEPLYRL